MTDITMHKFRSEYQGVDMTDITMHKFRSEYQGVDMTDITMHKFLEKGKEKLPRGGEWKVTKTRIFVVNIVTNTQDKKKNRAMKRKCSLLRRYLRKDAFPSVFPDCPRYLSTSKRVPRTATATSSERQAVVLLREEKERLELQRLDCVETLGDIKIDWRRMRVRASFTVHILYQQATKLQFTLYIYIYIYIYIYTYRQ